MEKIIKSVQHYVALMTPSAGSTAKSAGTRGATEE
jgi:hypothetical protein